MSATHISKTRLSPTSTYQSTKAMQSKEILSAIANINVVQLAFNHAFLIWSCINLSYLLIIVSSSVRADTVLKAPMASAANFALSAKTSLFSFSNCVSYRILKKAAAMMSGIEEQSVMSVSFHPK